jgi:hypothetical protein
VRRARRAPLPRDQDASPFHFILEEFLDLVPFARGAAVFDFEGETVDYAGGVDPYDLKVAAATFQIMLHEARNLAIGRGLRSVNMNLTTASYLVHVLDDGYSLLVVLRTLGAHCVSERLLREVRGRLLAEAGLEDPTPATWHRVEALVSSRGRPSAIRDPRLSEWVAVDVLGSFAVPGTERGFRVHTATGSELNLVGERQGLWFIDEKLDVALRAESPAARAAFVASNRPDAANRPEQT